MKIETGIALTGTGNAREHPMARHKRVKKEKAAMGWLLTQFKQRPEIPCTFVITRVAPSTGLDDDGLVHSCKSIRDALADWMLIDDKHRTLVRYVYAQANGEWGLRVESREGIA